MFINRLIMRIDIRFGAFGERARAQMCKYVLPMIYNFRYGHKASRFEIVRVKMFVSLHLTQRKSINNLMSTTSNGSLSLA